MIPLERSTPSSWSEYVDIKKIASSGETKAALFATTLLGLSQTARAETPHNYFLGNDTYYRISGAYNNCYWIKDLIQHGKCGARFSDIKQADLPANWQYITHTNGCSLDRQATHVFDKSIQECLRTLFQGESDRLLAGLVKYVAVVVPVVATGLGIAYYFYGRNKQKKSIV